MLIFKPASLEKALRESLDEIRDSFSLSFEGGVFNAGFDAASYPDFEITPDTAVTIEFPRGEDIEWPLGAVLQLVREVTHGNTTFDGLKYHSSVRTVLRVGTLDVRTHAFAHQAATKEEFALSSVVHTDKGKVEIGLTNLSGHFAASVVLKDHYYDKYHPPITPDDLFVEARHLGGCDAETAAALIHAYIFELHASLGLLIAEEPRVAGEAEYPEDEEIDQLLDRAKRRRPLLVGPGLYPVISEFNRGVTAASYESSIISYVKCIEYVSATVVREKQYEDLRKRLLSPEALQPNAEYMDGLMALFEENRRFTKDAEALRLTVERCCDPVLLARHAPDFLKLLARISATSKPTERKDALAEIAACLSATRNQLAHAKPNYELTGRECPADKLQQLAACAQLAAEQCLRWYAAQSPELRRK